VSVGPYLHHAFRENGRWVHSHPPNAQNSGLLLVIITISRWCDIKFRRFIQKSENSGSCASIELSRTHVGYREQISEWLQHLQNLGFGILEVFCATVTQALSPSAFIRPVVFCVYPDLTHTPGGWLSRWALWPLRLACGA